MFSSPRAWLVSLFTILIVAAVNVGWWIFYNRTASQLDAQLGRRLEAIAGTVSLAFSPTTVDSILFGTVEAQSKAASFLRQVELTDSLSELFLIDSLGNYLATTSDEPETRYLLAELNALYIDSLFSGATRHPLASSAFRTGDLYLKTAFAPLYDSREQVMGVVGVEADVDYFDALNDLRRNLIFSTVISALGGLAFGALFFLFQFRLARAQLRAAADETNAFLGRMVAVVSHEIKNPLAIIRASAERIHKKTPVSESGFIIDEVDRLNSIVSGYLDFARSGTGGDTTGDSELVDLHELTLELTRNVNEKYQGRTIHWSDLPTESIMARVHRRALRQVLLNLLFNAADACIGAERDVRIGMSVAKTAQECRIAVIDQGPGLPRKELDRVFEPFYTTKQHGSGLGLFVSRKVVERMHGTIHIESQVDHGTRVIITLPLT